MSYYKSKMKDEHINDNESQGTISVAVLAIIICSLFIFCAFCIETNTFSIALSVLSVCITLTFEIYEWIDYIKKVKQVKAHKHVSIFPPLLSSFVIFAIIEYIFIKLNLNLDKCTKLPNILSSVIICIYSLSYSIRRYKKIKHNIP